jgi:hypothetical protein
VPTADCPDAADVPLSYLQSSNLIEKRFGWETKDYSVTQVAPVRHKSWMALRTAVAGAGAFNFIAAAAAAAPLFDDGLSTASEDSLTSAVRPQLDPAPNAPVIVLEATPVTDLVAKLMKESHLRSTNNSVCEDDASLGSLSKTKLPTFHISKEVPQKMSPERQASPKHGAHTPPAPHLTTFAKPAKPVVAKEDANSAKMKANTKEFHDRYNGLIFKDSGRNLIWQDTEDLILGTHRHHKNAALNVRSDMRWAGKTLNMFRPWSAAREEDVIDQFLQRQASSGSILGTSRPNSTPDSTTSSAKNSPSASPLRGSTPLPRIESMSLSSNSGAEVRPERGIRVSNSAGAGAGAGRDKTGRTARLHSDAGSVSGSVAGSASGSVTFGAVTYNSGKTHGSSFHLQDTHHAHHGRGDGHSVADTLHSHGSHGRSSVGPKRTPLLINVVKNLPSPERDAGGRTAAV